MHFYGYSQFNSKHGVSVQIKPDQIKSKRCSLGSKYNRPEHAPVISSIMTRTNHQIYLKSLRNVSVQIKPDQIKSKRCSLGSKYNRPGARTGHVLNSDSDKSPNLSKVIKGCLGSNQTRPDQIQLGSTSKTKVYANTSKYQSIKTSSIHKSTWSHVFSIQFKIQPVQKKYIYIYLQKQAPCRVPIITSPRLVGFFPTGSTFRDRGPRS